MPDQMKEQKLAVMRMMQWGMPILMLIGAAAAYMLMEDSSKMVVVGILVGMAAMDFAVFKILIAKAESGE